MKLIAAAAPAQSAPAYQNTTVQQATPQPRAYRISVVQLLYAAINIVVVVVLVILAYRFVRAWEKIANKVDKGIVIRKEDTTT